MQDAGADISEPRRGEGNHAPATKPIKVLHRKGPFLSENAQCLNLRGSRFNSVPLGAIRLVTWPIAIKQVRLPHMR